MLSFLALFANWYVLALLGVIALGAFAIYAIQGPAVLLADALDWHTWAIILAAVIGVTLYSSSQTIEKQKETIAATHTDNKAGKDSLAVVSDAITKKAHRADQSKKQQDVIDNSVAGSAEDDLLDEIQRENEDAGRTDPQL